MRWAKLSTVRCAAAFTEMATVCDKKTLNYSSSLLCPNKLHIKQNECLLFRNKMTVIQEAHLILGDGMEV